MSLVPIFVTKSQFGPSILFSSQFGSWFGKFDFNVVISVSGTITTLNGVSRVSSSIFWIFYFFYIFLKNKKICHMPSSSCHVAVTKWCDRDNVSVSIMPGVISSVSIWSLYSNFCLNLVLICVKIVQFRPSPNWKKKLYKCYTNIFLKFDIFIQIDIFIIYF